MNYTDFLQKNNIKTNNIDKEKEKLKSDLTYYKSEYEKLKKENKQLQDENIKLNNELIKANKIIANFTNNSKENTNLNEIINLKNIILNKENEIMNLKLQLQSNDINNKPVNFNDIMVINFYSLDQNINYGIKCLKTDTFAEVEEKLYQKYPDYRNTNNNFIAKGGIVLRFKKIFENGIIDGDRVQLIKIE